MGLIVLLFAIGIVLGAGLCIGFVRLRDLARIAAAEEEAKTLVQEAKDIADELMDQAKERVTELEEKLWHQNEKELGFLQKKVDDREEEFRGKRSTSDREYNQDTREIQKQSSALSERAAKIAERQAHYEALLKRSQEIRQDIIQRLHQSSGQDINELKSQLVSEVENQAHINAKRKAQMHEDDIKASAEEIAKKFIATALSRFPRESCTERGIGIVELANEDQKKRLIANDGKVLTYLAELCGVEIAINENNTVAITSFDPVRRELSTRCLEKILNERNITQQVVDRLFEKTKRDLFNRIENDGRKITAELGQQDLHVEIKKMLGTLRYRYSFAQNQHYHVGEVGWLCGLLASELGGVKIKEAKRSGLLHDVGKAMDHEIEGGHAVIGADFIQKHGERSEIVHAVRAHHYEEQPNSDLAFLVIAADAISGARPGARRSTVNVYNQKIEALATIGDGFPGVTKTLVLNAGREVRILVDAARVNDEQSLKLCKDIAVKIENECTYPGQIRVVVIRETHADAMAK